jgi:hypothetical protein
MPVVEVNLERCLNGHPLTAPGSMQRGWPPCLCVEGHTGHRTRL